MSEYMPEDMSDRMPEDMSEYMPEDMPDRMPDWMPEDMSDRVPEDMPDRMPEDLPDRMPEDMPEDMPDHMPEDMPDRMPNRMSEDMSDRMPEDLPVRKCINVMVGITRSKVILFAVIIKAWCFRWFSHFSYRYIGCFTKSQLCFSNCHFEPTPWYEFPHRFGFISNDQRCPSRYLCGLKKKHPPVRYIYHKPLR